MEGSTERVSPDVEGGVDPHPYSLGRERTSRSGSLNGTPVCRQADHKTPGEHYLGEGAQSSGGERYHKGESGAAPSQVGASIAYYR